MMPKQNHIIKSQDIEIEFRDRKQDMGLPNYISDLVRLRLNEKLEGLFDSMLPHGNLAIDELVIDLGELKSENWENEFIDKALLKIRQAIVEQTPTYTVESAGHRTDKQSDVGVTALTPEEQLGLYRTSSVAQMINEFIYFLKNGAFTWKYSSYTLNELLQNIQAIIERQPPYNAGVFNELYALLLQSNTALTRFLNQSSNTFFDFIGALLPTPTVKDESIFSEYRFSNKNRIGLNFIVKLWKFYENNNLSGHALNAELVAKNIEVTLFKIIVKENMPGSDEVKIRNEITEQLHIERVTIQWEQKQNRGSEEKILTNKSEKKEVIPNEFFIHNSGLVILHPFLPMFFKELNLLEENNEWKNELSCEKAVLVSQYLVNGKLEQEEPSLLLNKLLCGMAFETPVINQIELTDKEIYVCSELLNAVITHWNALKSTSGEGLQNSFLQREGRLICTDGIWNLTVEQKAWDILLGQLPWGIGMIKTPWMNNILQVNWG